MKEVESISIKSEKAESIKIIFDEFIKINIKNILEVNYTIEKYSSNSIPESYFNKLLNVANDWFWIKMWEEDVKNHLYKSEEVFILKINNIIVWFSSLNNLEKFTYRFGTVIKKEYQKHWLYKKLNKVILEKNKKYFLRTQNKNVIKSLEKTFDNVIYWKKALNFMKEGISVEKINNFMINNWDEKEILDENGIFKRAYKWKMWQESRVDYIDKDFYNDFNSELWDSELPPLKYSGNKKMNIFKRFLKRMKHYNYYGLSSLKWSFRNWCTWWNNWRFRGCFLKSLFHLCKFRGHKEKC